jgi:hypothetical protein
MVGIVSQQRFQFHDARGCVECFAEEVIRRALVARSRGYRA